MKKTILILLITISWIPGKVLAQDEKTNELGFHWGVGNLQRQDIRFSPYVHTPWSAFNFGLSYEHTGKQFHRVYARFGWYKSMIGEPYTYTNTIEDPPEEVETLPHNFNVLDLDYTLGFFITKNDKRSFLLGGKIRNQLNQGPYEYGNSAVGAYHFVFSADLWGAYRYKFNNKHSIKAELSLPVISWVASSPYLGQDSKYIYDSSSLNALKTVGNYIADGELQSWGTSQSVDLQLGYLYNLGDRWNLKAEYNLHFNSTNKPQPYTSIENLLLFGAQLKL